MSSLKSSFAVGGRTLKADVRLMQPSDIDNDSNVPLSLIHEHQSHFARLASSKLSSTMMDVRTVITKGIALEIASDELAADKDVPYERLALISKDGKTIHGTEAVQKAQLYGKSVLALQLQEEISFPELFLIQLRYSTKEGVMSPRAKSEAYRFGKDELGISVAVMRKMSVTPKGKLPTSVEITKDIRVGRIYKANPNFKVDFRGFTLDERPHSNLKFLVGQKEIFELMEKDEAQAQHFIRMAVVSSHSGQKRLQDSVPQLLKFPETKEALFTSGLNQAKQILKTRFPEEDRELHPHFDIEAAKKKSERTDTRARLAEQFQMNPNGGQTHAATKEFIASYVTISPQIAKAVLENLFEVCPELFCEVAAARGLTEVARAVERLRANQVNALKAIGATAGLSDA